MMKKENKVSLAQVRAALLSEARVQQGKIKAEFGHLVEGAKSQGRRLSFIGVGALGLYIFAQILVSESRKSKIKRMLQNRESSSSNDAVVIKESSFSPMFESIRTSIAQFLLNVAQKELTKILKRYADQWDKKE